MLNTIYMYMCMAQLYCVLESLELDVSIADYATRQMLSLNNDYSKSIMQVTDICNGICKKKVDPAPRLFVVLYA